VIGFSSLSATKNTHQANASKGKIMKPRSVGLSVLGALAATSLIAGTAAAGSTTSTLANGAELEATISTPTTGETFLIAPPDTTVDVPIEGNASIGEGEPNVHWTYVVDVSGSTGQPCGAGNILACQKQAVLNLNSQIVADGSGLDVGVSVFGRSGATADMSSAGGNQVLNSPASADVVQVVNSIVIGGVNQFTPRAVSANETNFTSGLNAAIQSVTASSAASKNVVFMSDGASNTGGGGFNAAITSIQTAGATIYTFAVGASSSCNAGSDGTLQQMAVTTGGTCTNVPDPTTLPDIVQNVTDTQMTDVSVTVDGADVALDSESNPVPFDGPLSSDVTATAAGMAPGAHEVCLTATGLGPKSDATSEDSATRCETYQVYGFGLNPVTETNELSEDDTHTVTATLDGEPGEVEGFSVDFDVTSGPNAGETGNGTTDSDGDVEFTYTNPNIDPSGLGIDTIDATVTVNGETATLTVEKEWVDTIAPVSTCLESVNPNGKKMPSAPGSGGQGQNQDGFYIVEATDNIWPADALQVFVTDDGSDTVFGPFAVGTVIKWTEDDSATPEQKTIGGPNSAVDWHIIGNGDALVTTVDGSGNTSDGVACLVPPAPQ
jgi:hypothetical protein